MNKITAQSLFYIANSYYKKKEYVKSFILYDYLCREGDAFDASLLNCYRFNYCLAADCIDKYELCRYKDSSYEQCADAVKKILDNDGYADHVVFFNNELLKKHIRPDEGESHKRQDPEIRDSLKLTGANRDIMYVEQKSKQQKKKLNKNTLWHAQSIMSTGDYDGAISYAYTHADTYEKKAILALKANALTGDLSDDATWLSYVNDYIEQFAIVPLEMLPIGASRFDRLTAKRNKKIERGPLVTVIIPAYNAENTIEKSLRSILNQTWTDIELIIVDDASTDTTGEIIQKICLEDDRVIVFRNKANVGPYISKNIALRAARGDYITGHDADDWAHPERIEKHLQFMFTQRASIKATLCGCLRITKDGKFSRISKCGLNSRDGIIAGALISCMFESKYLKEVLGGWDEVRFGGDSEIIKRIEKITGNPLPRYHFPGIIALDAPDSLTNHPEHGYHPASGLSRTRKAYVENYSIWHQTITAENAFLPFPQKKRNYAVPEAMAVNRRALDNTIKGHTGSTDVKYNNQPIRSEDQCDVCIVTNLRYPGGNASSTLDEIRYFQSKKMKVLVIHCPNHNTQAKALSERYDEFRNICVYFYDISFVKTNLLIVRHPSVLTSSKFVNLSEKIQAEHAVVIINNSMLRSTGEQMYSLQELIINYNRINSNKKQIYPLGPAIRKELLKANINETIDLASFDWTPTFDMRQFVFNPKKQFSEPLIIGRHSRDAEEKWLENKHELLAIYPDSSEIEVCILGGADHAVSIIGYLPENWKVFPYGSIHPAEYLLQIDCFVYFPHSNLNEAFGRTVMEAIFCGVPCILPHRFRETFNNMAFYCLPEQVVNVVKRLAIYPDTRIEYLSYIKAYAMELYDTSVLEKRYNCIISDEQEDYNIYEKSIPVKLKNYRNWVETGDLSINTIF
ncbi:MAG: glycosyltransferase [Spirochaetes bacterium]|nr:glycosyltransferase [Spirochaetota bacterium]